MKSTILAEDKDILVCYKPPGIAVQSARLGEPDMVSELKNYLGGKNPYLGVVHRLDPVSYTHLDVYKRQMFVSGGIIPSYIVVNRLGLYDTPWALIVPTAISAYNLIVARSFFESLPEELMESAHLDGANDLVILWKIIVPVSKPIISVLIIFYAVGHWNEYFNPMIYLKSRELKPIQLYLRDILVANQQATTSTGGSTGAERQYLFEALKFSTIVITTLPITIIYPFFQKHFVQGVMIGAVKS